MALDRLTPEDVGILKLQRGAIRGHTCKVMVLEPAGPRAMPTVDALREHISSRLEAAPRLRKHVVSTPLRVARPVWLDDPQFDIARHVQPVECGAVSRGGLEQIVAQLMCERLDPSHPLWRLDVVERLEDGAMALIWRIHHALADGTTCLRLGSAMLWSEDPDEAHPVPASFQPEVAPGALALLAAGVRDRLRRGSDEPARVRQSWLSSRSVLQRELGPSAALTPLAHRAGAGRRLAFAAAPLEECKRAGKQIAQAVTINDVVLALVAGGLRAWLEQTRGPMEGIRVKVPVSLHRPDEGDRVGNRDSYFFVDLPVAEEDPVKRVLAINRETCERKLDHDAETLYHLGAHPFLAHWAMSPRVFTFNVSNVRGPASDVYVLGARISEMYSLAEIAQRHALRVAVVSASGSLFFGLCADRDAVSDLEVMGEGIRSSTEELLAAVD